MNPNPDGGARGRPPWGLVLLLVGAGMVAAFPTGKAPPALPAIRAEFEMSLFLAGWILAVVSVTGLLFGSVAGAAADRIGYRRLLIAGLAGQAAGSLLGAAAGGPALLLASRVLEGLGFIAVGVSAPALIFRVTPLPALRTALSLWSCYVPAGIALIMTAAPVLTTAFGWRGLWRVNAAAALACAALVAWRTRSLAGRPAGPALRPRQLWQDLRSVTTAPAPLLLALIFTAYALLWLAVMGFLPTLFVDAYGVVAEKAAYLTALMVAVNVPGNLAGGFLLQRGLRRSRIIAAALVVMGFATLAIYAASLPFSLRYLACLAFSGCGGMLPASIMSGVPLFSPRPELVGTANGLILQGSHLGQLIGPPVLALIVSAAGSWQAAPGFLLAVALAGILLAGVLASMERRSRESRK